MKGYLLLVLLAVSLVHATAQKREFSDQYRPDRRLLLDTRREADSLRVYLRFPNASVLRQGQPLRISAWPSFDARRPLWTDTVKQLARRIRPDGQGALVEFCLPIAKLTSGTMLSLACAPAAEAATGDAAWLSVTTARLARPYILTDSLGTPLLRRYVRSSEPFLVDRYGQDIAVLVRRYAAPFVAALPPHADPARQSSASPTLPVSDSLAFRAGMSVVLPEAGLYTLRLAGEKPLLGVLVTDEDYPELTTADELIQPLVYLTTSAERKKLYDAPNPKRAVDQFWLSAAAGQQTIARQAIRTYYGRAQAANELFVAHKAGWMTDRGMLYIALGPPDAVYRTAQDERWVYHGTNNGASATYTFRPKPSTFAPEHYELVRRPEYERLWYAAVEQWRKATTTALGR
ncbi:GWxTD domain-containing protein [Hymenobacter tibetensis]|uniref:GWxTD domain-containing protein n=1 Tax=Hymenobacter tibetensis TaxID=497967 RepID=A0ABY4CYM8_9BACT|nr:GWxTD domain-containing protein [Hymenobacter tibetensis]UOG74084.1 GWxTD domain-containing protein [Hymenobacter tibetensis]